MSFVTTFMTQYILKAANKFDEYEKFRGVHGAVKCGLDMVAQGKGPTSQEEMAKKIINATNQPQIAVIAGTGVQTFTARQTVPFTTNAGTSAFIQFTRVLSETTFEVTESAFNGNAVDAESAFYRKMDEAVGRIRQAMDVASVTAINGARTQVGAGSTFPYAFDATGDRYTLTVPAGATLTDRLELGSTLLESAAQPLIAAGIAERPEFMVGGSTMASFLRYQSRFSGNNYQNLAQINTGGMSPYLSTNIADQGETPTDLANFFAIAPYSYGVYTFTSDDAQRRREAQNGKAYTMFLPELGVTADIFETELYGDRSGVTGGYARQHTSRFAITVDFTIATTYQPAPTTVHAPIAKFSLIDA